MNPIFIPENSEKTEGDKRTVYRNRKVKEKNIRFIEYYNGEVLRAVGVWGICRKLEEPDGGFFVQDKGIDMETMRELRGPIEEMYPKPTKITFY